jgi:hypothetical protein
MFVISENENKWLFAAQVRFAVHTDFIGPLLYKNLSVPLPSPRGVDRVAPCFASQPFLLVPRKPRKPLLCPGLRLCLLPSVAPGPLFLLRLRYAPAQVCVAKTEANLGEGEQRFARPPKVRSKEAPKGGCEAQDKERAKTVGLPRFATVGLRSNGPLLTPLGEGGDIKSHLCGQNTSYLSIYI